MKERQKPMHASPSPPPTMSLPSPPPVAPPYFVSDGFMFSNGNGDVGALVA